jgi:hypothetical protein
MDSPLLTGASITKYDQYHLHTDPEYAFGVGMSGDAKYVEHYLKKISQAHLQQEVLEGCLIADDYEVFKCCANEITILSKEELAEEIISHGAVEIYKREIGKPMNEKREFILQAIDLSKPEIISEVIEGPITREELLHAYKSNSIVSVSYIEEKFPDVANSIPTYVKYLYVNNTLLIKYLFDKKIFPDNNIIINMIANNVDSSVLDFIFENSNINASEYIHYTLYPIPKPKLFESCCLHTALEELLYFHFKTIISYGWDELYDVLFADIDEHKLVDLYIASPLKHILFTGYLIRSRFSRLFLCHVCMSQQDTLLCFMRLESLLLIKNREKLIFKLMKYFYVDGSTNTLVDESIDEKTNDCNNNISEILHELYPVDSEWEELRRKHLNSLVSPESAEDFTNLINDVNCQLAAKSIEELLELPESEEVKKAITAKLWASNKEQMLSILLG